MPGTDAGAAALVSRLATLSNVTTASPLKIALILWQVAQELVSKDLIPKYDTMCQNYLVALADARWTNATYDAFKTSRDYAC